MSVETRRVEPSDYVEIEKWWKHRGRDDALPCHIFSDLGFIVPGICVVFLYATNSKIAFIENLQANPLVPHHRRTLALNAVIQAVCETARDLGYTHLLGTTSIGAVCQRAKHFGGHVVEGMSLIVVPLSPSE